MRVHYVMEISSTTPLSLSPPSLSLLTSPSPLSSLLSLFFFPFVFPLLPSVLPLLCFNARPLFLVPFFVQATIPRSLVHSMLFGCSTITTTLMHGLTQVLATSVRAITTRHNHVRRRSRFRPCEEIPRRPRDSYYFLVTNVCGFPSAADLTEHARLTRHRVLLSVSFRSSAISKCKAVIRLTRRS